MYVYYVRYKRVMIMVVQSIPSVLFQQANRLGQQQKKHTKCDRTCAKNPVKQLIKRVYTHARIYRVCRIPVLKLKRNHCNAGVAYILMIIVHR